MFGLFQKKDIQAGVEEYRSTPGAVLLDVRTAEEFAGGHILGSVNVPLDRLEQVDRTAGKDATLFVYCHSGARSARAAAALKRAGYGSVRDIGGIAAWRGPVEKGM